MCPSQLQIQSCLKAVREAKMLYASIVLITVKICLTSADCYSELDCDSCTRKTSWLMFVQCRWCPDDKACHAFGSIKNRCGSSIKNPGECDDKPLEIIPPEKAFYPETAYIYTLLSAVAYAKDPMRCSDQILSNYGFKLVDLIGRKCNLLTIFNYPECFAYTAVSDTKKTIVVAFKGTDSSIAQILDEIASVLIIPKTPFNIGEGVKVQEYFYNTFLLFYSCVNKSVGSLVAQHPDYNVVITGHSLGGALASLTAAFLAHEKVIPSEKMFLYTFGMPRVGNKAYALKHDQLVNNSWRVVHFKDVVAHLPPCSLLGRSCSVTNGPNHHGREVFYNVENMTKNSAFKICNSDEDPSCSNGIISGCFLNFGKCIPYHKEYFKIPVGTYCAQRMYGKRSVVETATFWSQFRDDQCVSLPFNWSEIDTGKTTNRGHAILEQTFAPVLVSLSLIICR